MSVTIDPVTCAKLVLYIPPLELPDGTIVPLKNAEAQFPPIPFALRLEDGTMIKAKYWPLESRWEIE